MTEKTDRRLIGSNDDIYTNLKRENLSGYENSLNLATPSPEEIMLTIEKLAEDDRDAIEDTIN